MTKKFLHMGVALMSIGGIGMFTMFAQGKNSAIAMEMGHPHHHVAPGHHPHRGVHVHIHAHRIPSLVEFAGAAVRKKMEEEPGYYGRKEHMKEILPKDIYEHVNIHEAN